jgi:NitT/TauT family transport system substrate-binding protein
MVRVSLVGLIVGAAVVMSCGPATAPPPAPTAAPAPAPTPTAVAAPKPVASTVAGPARAQTYTPSPLTPPVKVSIGVLASTSDGGIFIAQDRGYFKQEGIELEFTRFQTLVEMVAPLTSGQLQVAAGGLAASVYNASDRGIALRIVADKGQAAGSDWDFSALVVRKDLIESGKVKDYADLKGLTLVTSGRGNSPEVALAAALKKGGLSLQDVNFTQMGFPDMVAAFQNKGIDGAIVIEPFVSRIVSDGTGVRWKGNFDIFGANEQIAAIVFGEQFATKPDVAQRWMNAYLRGVRDYNDGFGPKKKGFDDVVSILVNNTTVKDPKIFAQMKPAGLDPDGKLDLASIKRDLGYYIESGQVKPGTDLTKLIDTSFQEKAAQALGPYVP